MFGYLILFVVVHVVGFFCLFVCALISMHFSTFKSSPLWNSNWEVTWEEILDFGAYDFFSYIF